MNLTFASNPPENYTSTVIWNVQELDDAGSEGMRGYRPGTRGVKFLTMLVEAEAEAEIYLQSGALLEGSSHDCPWEVYEFNKHGDGKFRSWGCSWLFQL